MPLHRRARSPWHAPMALLHRPSSLHTLTRGRGCARRRCAGGGRQRRATPRRRRAPTSWRRCARRTRRSPPPPTVPPTPTVAATPTLPPTPTVPPTPAVPPKLPPTPTVPPTPAVPPTLPTVAPTPTVAAVAAAPLPRSRRRHVHRCRLPPWRVVRARARRARAWAARRSQRRRSSSTWQMRSSLAPGALASPRRPPPLFPLPSPPACDSRLCSHYTLALYKPPSTSPILVLHPSPSPTLTPHPIPPRGSHDSVITNPVLGWNAMMDYVSEWQTALGYGEDAAAAPAARGSG